MKNLYIAQILFLLAACGDGGSTPDMGPFTPLVEDVASKAQIEKSLGATLEKPVFQCGSGTDSLTADAAPDSVAGFESGPVRPIALSVDGKRLCVTKIPAHCLEIYAVIGDTLTLAATLSVGLEPVTVAERNADEVWVVNPMSDSVSIVRLDGTPRVLRTLQVGDEPRALAVTPDGATVYAPVLNSGNGTTTLHRDALKTGLANATVKPTSPTSADGAAAPSTSLIVRYKNGTWVDENG